MSTYTLRAGTLYTPIRCLKDAWITVEDGRIAALEERARRRHPTYDFRDAIVIPGLVDLQVNGGLGYSFQADHRGQYEKILHYHRARGTAVLLPTLVTAPAASLLESLAVLSGFIRARGPKLPALPGIHLEGPFLSPEKSGAHDPAALQPPDPALAARFLAAADGALRIFTLAPELPGALEVIRTLAGQGVIVSAGHTAATYDQLKLALGAGLRMATHLGNASDWPHRAPGPLGFLASEPGLVGTFMAVEELRGSVILDGFHFHPALLGPLLKLKGPDALLLVSDASTIAGCPPGEYDSGGLLVTVHPAGFATSGRGGGWLAGSVITLLDAVVRAATQAQIPLQQAVHMASLGPARLLGIAERVGHLEPGANANLVVLNQDLTVRTVLFGEE